MVSDRQFVVGVLFVILLVGSFSFGFSQGRAAKGVTREHVDLIKLIAAARGNRGFPSAFTREDIATATEITTKLAKLRSLAESPEPDVDEAQNLIEKLRDLKKKFGRLDWTDAMRFELTLLEKSVKDPKSPPDLNAGIKNLILELECR